MKVDQENSKSNIKIVKKNHPQCAFGIINGKCSTKYKKYLIISTPLLFGSNSLWLDFEFFFTYFAQSSSCLSVCVAFGILQALNFNCVQSIGINKTIFGVFQKQQLNFCFQFLFQFNIENKYIMSIIMSLLFAF